MTTLAWMPETFEELDRAMIARSDGTASPLLSHKIGQPTRQWLCSSELASAADRAEIVRVWGEAGGGAGSFTWLPPREATPVECRFVENQFKIDQAKAARRYQIQIGIEALR